MTRLSGDEPAVIELGARPCACPDQAERLRQRLLEAGRGSARLIIDCRQTEFFTAALLGLLVGVTTRLAARPGDVILCGLRPLAREVLRVTCLDRLWPTFDTLEEALAASPPPAPAHVVGPRL
jgi:anti-anti-sigma factor